MRFCHFQAVKSHSNQQKSFRQDKDHRYYKCPKCGNILRIPRGKGKIEISVRFVNGIY